MHELRMVQLLLEQIDAECRRVNVNKVSAVHVRWGALRQIVPEVFQFAFDTAKVGTVAEDAVLNYEIVPMRIACSECSTEFESYDLLTPCPKCGAYGGNLLSGDEFILDSLEIADNEEEVPCTSQ